MTAIAIVAGIAALLLAGLWVRERRRGRDLRGQLEEARRAADRADHARESFFDLVTHELRSPLAAILGYQELLRDGAFGPVTPDAEEPVDRIGRSARHLLHLIDGVVELSRLRSGTVRPGTTPVDFRAILPGIADAFRRQAADRRIEAYVHWPDHLPTLRSDADRVTRALDLLVTSAIKHPAGGAMNLRIETSDGSLTVRMDGTAIPPRQPADDPALRYGLRVAVAERIAALLGGELSLQQHDEAIVSGFAFRIADLPPGPAPPHPGFDGPDAAG